MSPARLLLHARCLGEGEKWREGYTSSVPAWDAMLVRDACDYSTASTVERGKKVLDVTEVGLLLVRLVAFHNFSSVEA